MSRGNSIWPGNSDYSEAIQSPLQCFRDHALRESRVVNNKRGLPLVSSGQFAVVFKLEGRDGRAFAVRCFLKHLDERESRYRAIAGFLSAHKLPGFSQFRYLPSEILVRGQRFPVLAMDWLAGQTLDDFILKAQPAQLEALPGAWRKVISRLESAGVSHGDLQHGNVLFDGSSFQLVDYDGMFVPALLGQKGTEIGHRNFQHPRRTELDFHDAIDRFSALVIFASLVAYAEFPKLRDTIDDSLLFKAEDFRDWTQSAVVARVAREVPSTVALLDAIRSALAGPVSSVERLENVASLVRLGTAGGAGWWRPPSTSAPSTSTRGTQSTPEWLRAQPAVGLGRTNSQPAPPNSGAIPAATAGTTAPPRPSVPWKNRVEFGDAASSVVPITIVTSIAGTLLLGTEWGANLAHEDVVRVRETCVVIGAIWAAARVGWRARVRRTAAAPTATSQTTSAQPIAGAFASTATAIKAPNGARSQATATGAPPRPASPIKTPSTSWFSGSGQAQPTAPPLGGSGPSGAPKLTPLTANTLVVASRGRWIYHRPSCEWARKISPMNRTSFRDSGEARAAGFKACRTCQP